MGLKEDPPKPPAISLVYSFVILCHAKLQVPIGEELPRLKTLSHISPPVLLQSIEKYSLHRSQSITWPKFSIPDQLLHHKRETRQKSEVYLLKITNPIKWIKMKITIEFQHAIIIKVDPQSSLGTAFNCH